MTDETLIPQGGVAIEPPAETGAEISVAEAARAYTAALGKPKKEEQSAENAEPATAEQELSGEDNAAPREEAHGEDKDIDPANEPPIERPKSWTEAEDAEWKATPRTLQQKIVARELERDSALRRSQNDAAEKLKGLTAKEQQAEQVRQQYEAKLPELVKQIHQQGPFADIKSQDDADALAQNDPFRYLQWDAYQKRLAGMAHEAREVEARQSQERQNQWAQHVQKENELAAELIPDLADKVKGPALTQRAAERLGELGFKPEELNDLASGKTKLSIYDHRLQQLIFSDLKLSDIQRAKVAVAKPDLPPVVRPGTSKPAGSGDSEQIKTLTRQLEQTGDIRIATRLYELEQRAARRAS